MIKYVVKDQNGKYQIVGAEGFIPKNAVCIAPPGSQPNDGPYIIVTNGVATFDELARAHKPVPVE